MQFEYLFLVAGLALVIVMERAVIAWSSGTAGGAAASPADGLQMRPMAWQTDAWRNLVSRGFALAAGLCLAMALRFEGFEAARVAVIAIALLACAATDLLAYRVPDVVTLPALAFALASSAAFGRPEIVSAVVAAGMAGGLLLAAAVLTRGGLGGGDVKLGALIGASLGMPAAAFALAGGIVAGGFFVIVLYATGRLKREQAFPFAPFLALAASSFLLAG